MDSFTKIGWINDSKFHKAYQVVVTNYSGPNIIQHAQLELFKSYLEAQKYLRAWSKANGHNRLLNVDEPLNLSLSLVEKYIQEKCKGHLKTTAALAEFGPNHD